MRTFPELNKAEQFVYCVISASAIDGVCRVPACEMYRRCKLRSRYFFQKHANALERKGLITQEPGWQGIPWTATLVRFFNEK